MKNYFKVMKYILIITLIAITIALLFRSSSMAELDSFSIVGAKCDNDGNAILDANSNTQTAESATYDDVKVGDSIRLRNGEKTENGEVHGTNRLFADNPNLFCAQHGVGIGKNPQYKVVNKVVVDPIGAPVLAYILNMNTRADDETSIKSDVKQNMIWWYLYTNRGNLQNNQYVKAILDLNNTNISDYTVPEPEMSNDSGNTKYNSEFETAIINAEKYANKVRAFNNNISITNMTNDGTYIKFKVEGTYDSFDIYINNTSEVLANVSMDTEGNLNVNSGDVLIENEFIKIPIEKFTSDVASVSLKAKMNIYKANFFALQSTKTENLDQRLIYVVPGETEIITNDSVTSTITIPTKVSLQKYIVYVNSTPITQNETALTDRENKRTSQEDINAENNRVLDNISLNNPVPESDREKYKFNEPVKIKVGDTVTYRVTVYNNSSITATNVVIRDRLPCYISEDGSVKRYASIEAIVYSGVNNNSDQWNLVEWTEDNSNNDYTYKYIIPELPGYTGASFDIKVKYNKWSQNILTNTAWIDSQIHINSNEYRTLDRDYIEMEKYSVSLEKFVTKVTDAWGNNQEVYNNRAGYRRNTNLDGDTNRQISSSSDVDAITYSSHKTENKVQVETGDLVTFTIRLKNTGENPVKVTQIYDIYTRVDNQLEFDSDYGIKSSNGTQIGTIVENVQNDKDHYTGPDQSFQLGDRYCHLIDFGNGILLQPEGQTGDYADITMRFKVNVPPNLTTSDLASNSPSNKAGIVQIKNNHGDGDVVVDNDGIDNNVDQDWLKLKTYDVSLEKYVSKVVDTNGNIEEYNGRAGKAQHGYDNDNETENNEKYNDTVTVSKGDKVTYKIKLKNDGNTTVKITNVTDYLPHGVKYEDVVEYLPQDDADKYCKKFEHKASNIYDAYWNLITVPDNGQTDNKQKINSADIELEPGAIRELEVEVTVIEDNISQRVLKNVAEIISMKNRNDVPVLDTTGNNNKDADYIQLDYQDIVETTSHTVKKIWNIPEGTNLSTSFVRVKLFKVEAENEIDMGMPAKILQPANDWQCTWDGLPMGAEYIAREINSDGEIVKGTTKYNENTTTVYNTRESGKTTITNTLTPVQRTSYKVKKVWNIAEGSNARPEPVTVKLFKVEDGSEIDAGERSVVLSNDNNWQYTWNNLNSDVEYIAREINPDGEIVKGTTKYNENTTTVYSSVEGEIVITNIPKGAEPIEFTVEKVWDDNNNPSRPREIKVRLYKIKSDNTLEAVGDVIPLNNSNWSYTWTDLPKYEGDSPIRYTARELKDDNSIVDEGGAYNDSYKAYYLNETNKTTITNKMTVQENDDDLAIAGIVWNDLALDKTQSDYNGEKDEQETVLSGVKVMLYRVEEEKVVATTYTNPNGEYSFTNESLSNNSDLDEWERFIKGPKCNENGQMIDRWTGAYYSYYVIFEYNGVTYTSTLYNNFASANPLDSNAKEDIGEVTVTRSNFNSKFNTIKNDGAYDSDGRKIADIEYTTKNESGYIPQSINKYNRATMDIQSSTEKIDLRRDANLEKALKHVNLGLRGRDVFDLELTSNVYSTKVTVNGVDGQYNYDDNKVTVRRIDTNNYNYSEDTANPHLDVSQYKGDEYDQKVRTSDVTNGVYGNTGLKIEVTYKITVTNASNTAGTATKITNYYDDAYTFVKAYSNNPASEMTIENEKAVNGTSGTGYKSVIVTTPGTELGQNGQMEIYVVYELNDAAVTLQRIAEGEKLATFNMAEITEYKTFRTGDDTTNNEATRGLIDKDSAPGSVATEKVRLYPDLIDEDNTTVAYYFGGNDLSVLKYEDDTYATPTLYFVKGTSDDSDTRIITGKVFRDSTETHPTTRIKTGNGIYEEAKYGEVGVYGATVQLIELVEENDQIIEKIRYTTTTEIDEETGEVGIFEFRGFLPGNYIIRYYYGDTANTVLVNPNGTVNAYSFNGEDYQSTNNSYIKEGMDTNQLNTTPNFWYAYNEGVGISTAKDNVARRNTVTTNVLDDSNNIMTLLNNIRDRITINETEVNSLTEKTHMFAETAPMKFTVEETVKITDSNRDFVNEQKDSEGNGLGVGEWTKYTEYLIENMNFGIAEVPVTKIDLQKEIQGFTIIDSTGQNILAKFEKNGELMQGNISPSTAGYLAQIEDEKLQGSRLQITYNIKSDVDVELNYDNIQGVKATINELIDIVDNNLTYNKNLSNNSMYWVEIENDEDITSSLANIDNYSTKVKTTDIANEKLNAGETIQITLEKILSSTNSTMEEIITSTVDVYKYSNTVEITKLNYANVTSDETNTEPDGTTTNPDGTTPDSDSSTPTPQIDRVRTPDRYIIIPGVQHDTASSETIAITPPTGNGSMDITYYVLAAMSLVVLAVGVFGIKKFVVNTRK